MNKNINIKVHGKWILAGEYSVLRSYPALAFPLFSRFIELNYQKGDTPLQIKVNTDSSPLFQSENSSPSEKTHILSFFESVLDQALLNISKRNSNLRGTITLHPHISFGAGLGTSAVVCVLIGRLFHELEWFREEDLFPFCHTLENILHGQSSGVDIAAVLIEKPILFLSEAPNKQIQILHPKWHPPIFLSHSGRSRSTKSNIKKIKQFWSEDPKSADALNRQMTQAVLKAKEGLEMEDEKEGLPLLTKSFSLAEECFSKWNLISRDTKEHISFLKSQGALAAKPTGSGAGGCVISLWPKSLPGSLSNQLISVF